jgi:SAM-dependent methyltransferase
MEIYKQPLYYEIAFGFIDPKEQVDNFERISDKFGRTRVRRFLDIACGPSPQLMEIARRGYEAVGLDSSPEMLAYLRVKAQEEGLRIETVKADMCRFRLKEKVDFAFIMMGSLNVKSNDRFLVHLDSVAASLKRGGLYFIQNMGLDWTKDRKQSWTVEREGIKVTASYEYHFQDVISQTGIEKMTLEVDDHGKRKRFCQEEESKFIFPQEFKTLLRLNGKFEFIGWWKGNRDTWLLDQPLEKAKDLANNMVLLRRK